MAGPFTLGDGQSYVGSTTPLKGATAGIVAPSNTLTADIEAYAGGSAGPPGYRPK